MAASREPPGQSTTRRREPAGLDPALVRNVRASKQARRALGRRPDLVRWVRVTEADHARAVEAGIGAASCDVDVGPRPDDAEQRADEYARLYAEEQLDPARHELPPAAAVALLRAVSLQPSDRFLDLGCARGALVLAAAATTECERCAGVELSPSSHAAAEEARARHMARNPADAARVLFLRGDLRHAATLGDYSVYFCAVGATNRGRLTRELVARLASLPALPGCPPRPRRLLLAGCGVDGSEHVVLQAAYALEGTACSGTDTALPLYSDTQGGPRVVLEYLISAAIRIPAHADADAASRTQCGGAHAGIIL